MHIWFVFLFLIGPVSAMAAAGKFRKSDDSRCRFYFELPRKGSGLDYSPLLKAAGISLSEFRRQNKLRGPWLDFAYGSEGAEEVAVPKFIYGQLMPQYPVELSAKNNDVALNEIFTFDGETQLLFPNEKDVPCGQVMIHPKKWELRNGFLTILKADFTPRKE